jgi:hypothetical protein
MTIKRGGLAHKASSTPPLFIEVPIPIHECERSCVLYARGINFSFFYYFAIGFWNCSESMVFLAFFFILFYFMDIIIPVFVIYLFCIPYRTQEDHRYTKIYVNYDHLFHVRYAIPALYNAINH